MEYQISYTVNNKISVPALENTALDGEIGARFDRFAHERLWGEFAKKEILREAEDCFRDQYDDEYVAGMWRGEFWGKLMLSLVRTARMKNDADIRETVRASVYRVLSFQREDGYLSTYRDNENIFPAETEKARRQMGWDCFYNWNIWGQKYTLWGLLEAAQYLDDEHVLACAARMADSLLATVKTLGAKIRDVGSMHGMAAGSIIKPMLVLYRLTGKREYLDFCISIAKDWDDAENVMPNLIRNAKTDVSPSHWYDQDNGYYAKAYEMMSSYDGLCELYRVTGETKYFEAVTGLWELAYKYESNILGSVGYCERFYDAADYADGATEICDVLHWMRLCHELFRLTGAPKYMDAFEKAYLNAFLAGIYADGKNGAFFVRGAGRHWDAEPQVETKYQHCCINNAARGFANAAESAVTRPADREDLYVNLYFPTRTRFENADGSVTSVRVGSGYTDKGFLPVVLRGAKPGTTLYLRVPSWSSYIAVDILSADGEKTYYKTPGTYAAIPVTDAEMTMRVFFDMSVRILDPVCNYRRTGAFCELPPDDYHRQRWVDAGNGVCDHGAMLSHPMSVVWRGPVLLARSKFIGSTEEEMFSGETIYGKERTATAVVMRHDRMLCMCRISVNCGGEEKSYVMCDYASAANRETTDGRYFSVYL